MTLVDSTSRVQLRRLRIVSKRVVRHRLTKTATVAALLVFLVSLVLPREYEANALLLPQVTNSQSRNLATLAARFGFGDLSASLSLDFYSEVLLSRTVIDHLLQSKYSALESDSSLLEHFGYTTGTPARRLEKGAKRFQSAVAISQDQTAGLLRLSVTASSPALAVELVDSLLASANRAVTNALITQASYQRQYLERRLEDAGKEMVQKEGTLERFYNDNRAFQQSPGLVIREQGLRREAEIARELYVTLRQEYEQARLSEARDVPTLSFVSYPPLPYRPRSPRPLRNAVLAVLAVVSIGTGLHWMRKPVAQTST